MSGNFGELFQDRGKCQVINDNELKTRVFFSEGICSLYMLNISWSVVFFTEKGIETLRRIMNHQKITGVKHLGVQCQDTPWKLRWHCVPSTTSRCISYWKIWTFQSHISVQGVGVLEIVLPPSSVDPMGPSKGQEGQTHNLPSGLLMILVCIILLDLEI